MHAVGRIPPIVPDDVPVVFAIGVLVPGANALTGIVNKAVDHLHSRRTKIDGIAMTLWIIRIVKQRTASRAGGCGGGGLAIAAVLQASRDCIAGRASIQGTDDPIGGIGV